MLERFLLVGGIKMKGSFLLADVRIEEVLSLEKKIMKQHGNRYAQNVAKGI
jgi:hypothetical protein